jgi:hypothetical protein
MQAAVVVAREKQIPRFARNDKINRSDKIIGVTRAGKRNDWSE